jgi:uncharacterized protein with FMN-binding domain
MKRGHKALIIVLSCIVVIVIGVVLVMGTIRRTSDWARTLTWDDPSLATLADGAYAGESHLSLPFGTAAANSSVSVVVHVVDHRYSSIELVKPKRPKMDGLAKRVVDNQTVKLDALSGATVTNSAFLMAVSNAVNGK